MIAACLCCAALLGLMTGCAGDFEPTGTSGTETQPKETSPSTEPTDATDGIVYDPSAWPKVTEYTGSPIMAADPNREFYISFANQDCDFYPSTMWIGLGFDLFTKTDYSEKDISVKLPVQFPYEVTIVKRDEEFQHIAFDFETGGYGIDGQQPYHYLCMQGIDLHDLGQKSSDASCAAGIYNSLLMANQATMEDHQTLMGGYVEPFSELRQKYVDAYKAQGTDAITDCHLYSITISFDNKKYKDETAEYVDITFGGETHRVEFGQWRFHSQDPEELSYAPKGFSLRSPAVLGTVFDTAYADGYIGLDLMGFTTTEAVTLTGLRWSGGGDLEVAGAKFQSKAENSNADFLWDGKQPLMLDKGVGANLVVYLYGERLKEYEMAFTGFLYVDYVLTDTGKEYTAAIPCKQNRRNQLWDTYCLAFLGVDVGEYYHYFPKDSMRTSWFAELPESWKTGK